MKELLIALSKHIDEDSLINDLAESVNKYRADRNEENKRAMMLFIGMVMIRYTTEHEDMFETIKRTDEGMRAIEMLRPAKS